MKTYLVSELPFSADGGPPCRLREWSAGAGPVRIEHLPVREKLFSPYLLDPEAPSPAVCREEHEPDLRRLVLTPIPLAAEPVRIAEKRIAGPYGTVTARLWCRAGCYSVELDSPSGWETRLCHPLTREVRLEFLPEPTPLLCILEDCRLLTVYRCGEEFSVLFSCLCEELSLSPFRFRRRYSDSRRRYEDLIFEKGTFRRTAFGCGRPPLADDLVPLAFSECVLEGFEEELQSYLSPDLAGTELRLFREFFGPADAVRLIGGRTALLSSGRPRFFRWTLEGGKIANLEPE